MDSKKLLSQLLISENPIAMKQTDTPEILINCLKDGSSEFDISKLSCEQWHGLLCLARTQRVLPFLWHRIQQIGLREKVPRTICSYFQQAIRRNTVRNLLHYRELRFLVNELKPLGIPLLLLKGIFLADAVYPQIGLREMNDIDIMVRPADLKKVSDILITMGYHPLSDILVDNTLASHHHLPKLIKKGFASFEIHWNLTNPSDTYSIDPEPVWQRSVAIRVAGCDVMVSSIEDLLLHLCFHTSYQHRFEFGLRPSLDIALTIERFSKTLDWQTAAERAKQLNWHRGVYLALRLAEELAGARVPEQIMDCLKPADMDEAIAQTAVCQIFTDKYTAVSIPVPFAKLLESHSFLEKLMIFWSRVFLPKTMISAMYSVSADSPLIYICYLRRIMDVLRRHLLTLRQYRKKDNFLNNLVERKNSITDWMEKE